MSLTLVNFSYCQKNILQCKSRLRQNPLPLPAALFFHAHCLSSILNPNTGIHYAFNVVFIMILLLLLLQGAKKYPVELPMSDMNDHLTVEDLAKLARQLTEVPLNSQKLIFKGNKN